MVTTIAKLKTKAVSLSTIIPLRGVSWSTYQALMGEVGENRAEKSRFFNFGTPRFKQSHRTG